MPATLVKDRLGSLEALGTRTHTPHAFEALADAGLAGWDVRKMKIRTSSNNTIPNMYALERLHPETRKREYLSIVGRVYTVHQNEEHADFLTALADQAEAVFTNAVALRDNKVIMLSMRLPEYIMVGGVSRVDLYLNAINSFDKSVPFIVSVDPVVAACANQLNYFRSKQRSKRGGVYVVRHTSGLEGKVQLAREALDLSMKNVDAFEREAERMINTTMTQMRFEEIIGELLPKPKSNASPVHLKATEDLTYLFSHGPANEPVRGSAWAGFNAWTEWREHYAPAGRGKSLDFEQQVRARAERTLTSDIEISHQDKAQRLFLRG